MLGNALLAQGKPGEAYAELARKTYADARSTEALERVQAWQAEHGE